MGTGQSTGTVSRTSPRATPHRVVGNGVKVPSTRTNPGKQRVADQRSAGKEETHEVVSTFNSYDLSAARHLINAVDRYAATGKAPSTVLWNELRYLKALIAWAEARPNRETFFEGTR